MYEKHPAVYIVTNRRHGVLYTGVTSNLQRRIWHHRNKTAIGFTARYNLVMLVYYEVCEDMLSAIAREKQIKAGSRKKKIALINAGNPSWRDLYKDICK